MTKIELSKYAGTRFYNLSTRMGAVRGTIYCLSLYEVTERGTCRYLREVRSCVANKAQYLEMEEYTNGVYHVGRPSADCITEDFIRAASRSE